MEDLGHMRLEDSARAHYDRFLYIYTEEVVSYLQSDISDLSDIHMYLMLFLLQLILANRA